MKVVPISIISILIFISCSKEPDTVSIEEPDVIENPSMGIIYDTFQGKNILVYADQNRNIITAFELEDGAIDTSFFQPFQEQFPLILSDKNGDKYDVFGENSSGGSDLIRIEGFKGYWFSIAAFYPTPTIYGEMRSPKRERTQTNDWNINTTFVARGAPKDAIPAIENPVFDLIDDEERFLNGTIEPANVYPDLAHVFIVKEDDKNYVFPYPILNWHEIVNATGYSVSYCPLTGTAFAFGNEYGDFGVSGLLFNNNLIMFDRNTESYWSQILLQASHGDLMDSELVEMQAIETNWKAALELSMVEECYYLTEQTSFVRDYDLYPYGDYLINQNVFLHRNEFADKRIDNKELVYSILIEGEAKTYRFEHFQ